MRSGGSRSSRTSRVRHHRRPGQRGPRRVSGGPLWCTSWPRCPEGDRASGSGGRVMLDRDYSPRAIERDDAPDGQDRFSTADPEYDGLRTASDQRSSPTRPARPTTRAWDGPGGHARNDRGDTPVDLRHPEPQVRALGSPVEKDPRPDRRFPTSRKSAEQCRRSTISISRSAPRSRRSPLVRGVVPSRAACSRRARAILRLNLILRSTWSGA